MPGNGGSRIPLQKSFAIMWAHEQKQKDGRESLQPGKLWKQHVSEDRKLQQRLTPSAREAQRLSALTAEQNARNQILNAHQTAILPATHINQPRIGGTPIAVPHSVASAAASAASVDGGGGGDGDDDDADDDGAGSNSNSTFSGTNRSGAGSVSAATDALNRDVQWHMKQRLKSLKAELTHWDAAAAAAAAAKSGAGDQSAIVVSVAADANGPNGSRPATTTKLAASASAPVLPSTSASAGAATGELAAVSTLQLNSGSSIPHASHTHTLGTTASTSALASAIAKFGSFAPKPDAAAAAAAAEPARRSARASLHSSHKSRHHSPGGKHSARLSARQSARSARPTTPGSGGGSGTGGAASSGAPVSAAALLASVPAEEAMLRFGALMIANNGSASLGRVPSAATLPAATISATRHLSQAQQHALHVKRQQQLRDIVTGKASLSGDRPSSRGGLSTPLPAAAAVAAAVPGGVASSRSRPGTSGSHLTDSRPASSAGRVLVAGDSEIMSVDVASSSAAGAVGTGGGGGGGEDEKDETALDDRSDAEDDADGDKRDGSGEDETEAEADAEEEEDEEVARLAAATAGGAAGGGGLKLNPTGHTNAHHQATVNEIEQLLAVARKTAAAQRHRSEDAIAAAEKSAALATPRSKYRSDNEKRMRAMVQILMKMDTKALKLIRREFARRKWSIPVYDFVTITQSSMSSSVSGTSTEIDALCEMFREIDVNGDGEMSWEEFTSHLVQLATGVYSDSRLERGAYYAYSNVEDYSSHDYHVDYCRYFPHWSSLVVFERGSRRFKIYSVADFKCLRTVRGHRGALLASEAIPEHNLLLTSAEDRTVCFWDFNTGSNAGAAAAVADNKSSAAASASASAASQQMHLTVSWRFSRAQTALCWTGHTLFTGDTVGLVTGWNVERAEQKFQLRGHTDVVMEMICIASLSLLATASLDGTIRLWDLQKKCELRAVLRGHEKGVIELAFCAELGLLVSGGLDSFILVWNLKPQSTAQAAAAAAAAAAATASGNAPAAAIASALSGTTSYVSRFIPGLGHAAVSGALQPPIILETPIQKLVGSTTGGGQATHTIGLAIAGTELVVGDSRGGFLVYELKAFTTTQSFQIPKLRNPTISCLTAVEDNATLICCGVKLFKFDRTSDVQAHLADDNGVQFACFNSVSLTFITASGSSIKIWDALTGRLEREDKNLTDQPSTTITACCLDDRQRRYIIGDHAGNIKVFNCANGAYMKSLDKHSREVSALLYAGGAAAALTPGSMTADMASTSATAAGAANGGGGGAGGRENAAGGGVSKQVLSASWDHSIVSHSDKMNIQSSVLRRHTEHTKDVTHLCCSYPMRMVVSASSDSTLCMYEWGLGPLLGKFTLRDGCVSAVCFLGRYPLLAVADDSGGLSIWFVRGHYFRVCRVWNTHGGPPTLIRGLCFDAENEILYSGDDDGFIGCWPLKNRLTCYFLPIAETEHIIHSKINVELDLMDFIPDDTGGDDTDPQTAAITRPEQFDAAALAASRATHAAALAAAAAAQAAADAAVIARGSNSTRQIAAVTAAAKAQAAASAAAAAGAAANGLLPAAGGTTALERPMSMNTTGALLLADSTNRAIAAGAVSPIGLNTATNVPPAADGASAATAPPHVPAIGSSQSLERVAAEAEAAASAAIPVDPAPVPAASGRGTGRGTARDGVPRAPNAPGAPEPMPPAAPPLTPHDPSSGGVHHLHYATTIGSNVVGASRHHRTVLSGRTYIRGPGRGECNAHATIVRDEQLTWSAHPLGVTGVDIIMNTLGGPTLLSWSHDGTVHLWKAKTGHRIGSLIQGHNRRNSGAAIRPAHEPWNFYFDLHLHRKQETEYLARSLAHDADDDADAERMILASATTSPATRAHLELKSGDQSHLTTAKLLFMPTTPAPPPFSEIPATPKSVEPDSAQPPLAIMPPASTPAPDKTFLTQSVEAGRPLSPSATPTTGAQPPPASGDAAAAAAGATPKAAAAPIITRPLSGSASQPALLQSPQHSASAFGFNPSSVSVLTPGGGATSPGGTVLSARPMNGPPTAERDRNRLHTPLSPNVRKQQLASEAAKAEALARQQMRQRARALVNSSSLALIGPAAPSTPATSGGGLSSRPQTVPNRRSSITGGPVDRPSSAQSLAHNLSGLSGSLSAFSTALFPTLPVGGSGMTRSASSADGVRASEFAGATFSATAAPPASGAWLSSRSGSGGSTRPGTTGSTAAAGTGRSPAIAGLTPAGEDPFPPAPLSPHATAPLPLPVPVPIPVAISAESPSLITTATAAANRARAAAAAAAAQPQAQAISEAEAERRRVAAAKQRAATMSGQSRAAANAQPKLTTFLHYPYPTQFAPGSGGVAMHVAASGAVPLTADRPNSKAGGGGGGPAGANLLTPAVPAAGKFRSRMKPNIQKSSALTADAARMKAAYDRNVSTNTNTKTGLHAERASVKATDGSAVGLSIKARPYVKDVAFKKTLNWASSSTSLIYQKPRASAKARVSRMASAPGHNFLAASIGQPHITEPEASFVVLPRANPNAQPQLLSDDDDTAPAGEAGHASDGSPNRSPRDDTASGGGEGDDTDAAATATDGGASTEREPASDTSSAAGAAVAIGSPSAIPVSALHSKAGYGVHSPAGARPLTSPQSGAGGGGGGVRFGSPPGAMLSPTGGGGGGARPGSSVGSYTGRAAATNTIVGALHNRPPLFEYVMDTRPRHKGMTPVPALVQGRNVVRISEVQVEAAALLEQAMNDCAL